MSYLSKSKWMSWSAAIPVNSRGDGAAPGAGAAAEVVAGRLGHPTRKSARTSTGKIGRSCQRRCNMKPPPFRSSGEASTVSRSSYHGSRGDQAGLVNSPPPRVRGCCSDPSASMLKSCQLPRRLDWKARWRPLGAQEGLSLEPGPAVSRRGGRPRRRGVDRRVPRQAPPGARGNVEQVDLRVAVLGERQRDLPPVGTPGGGDVDPQETGEQLDGPALEGEEAGEIRVAPRG